MCYLQQGLLLKGTSVAHSFKVSAEAMSLQCTGPWSSLPCRLFLTKQGISMVPPPKKILPMSPNCRVPFNNGLRCKCFAIHSVSTFDGLPKLLKRSKVCFCVCVTVPAGAQNVLVAGAQHVLSGLKLLILYGSKVIAPRRDPVCGLCHAPPAC